MPEQDPMVVVFNSACTGGPVTVTLVASMEVTFLEVTSDNLDFQEECQLISGLGSALIRMGAAMRLVKELRGIYDVDDGISHLAGNAWESFYAECGVVIENMITQIEDKGRTTK